MGRPEQIAAAVLGCVRTPPLGHRTRHSRQRRPNGLMTSAPVVQAQRLLGCWSRYPSRWPSAPAVLRSVTTLSVVRSLDGSPVCSGPVRADPPGRAICATGRFRTIWGFLRRRGPDNSNPRHRDYRADDVNPFRSPASHSAEWEASNKHFAIVPMIKIIWPIRSTVMEPVTCRQARLDHQGLVSCQIEYAVRRRRSMAPQNSNSKIITWR
jgi:hypothetical protein